MKSEMKDGMIMICAIVGVIFALGGCCYVPEAGVKSLVSDQSQWLMSIGTPCVGIPKNAKLLHEIGDLTLFVGETESDVVFNAKSRDESRNSLFLRRRTKEGADEWRLLLTSLGDCKAAKGMERFGRKR